MLLSVLALTVNSKSISIGSTDENLAAIDTGTTLVGGPTNEVLAFWTAVGGQEVPDMQGFFAFRMSSSLSLCITSHTDMPS